MQDRKDQVDQLLQELEKEGIKVETWREDNIIYIRPKSTLGRELFKIYLKTVQKYDFRYDFFHNTWFKEL